MGEVQYVNELGQPCTADGQLLGGVAGGIQYVNELGQPCTADGQPLGGEVQYVNEFGQPCTPDGQLLGGAAPIQYGAPAAPGRFNITPEQFQIIAQGGSLPQEHLQSLLAGNAPAPALATAVPIATTTPAAAVTT